MPSVEEPLPTVTAVVAAYNYEQYVGLALESALTQDYPAELLDVIVVDDGSTDSTAEVVQAIGKRFPGRVKLHQQKNGGLTAAINRARRNATGELIALLDADDIWLPSKTRRQVEVFIAHPEISGVFSNMMIIDAAGNQSAPVLSPDELARVRSRLETTDIGQFAQLLGGNFGGHSSIMVRATAFAQVPATLPYPDYWCMCAAARHGRVELIPESLALYRIHGANLTGGVSGDARIREHLKTLWFRLWVIRDLDLTDQTPAEIRFIADRGIEGGAADVFAVAGSHFVDLVRVEPAHAAKAQVLLEDATHQRGHGDAFAAAIATLKSIAWNPYQPSARGLLHQLVTEAEAADSRPDPLAGSREFVVLADAEDLLAEPACLDAYADAMSGLPGISLAIDATRLTGGASQLMNLVQDAGLSDTEDVHIVAFVDALDTAQRRRVRERVNAVYGLPTASRESIATDLRERLTAPSYTAETLRELRGELTARRC
jgi:glycosyltransferase involved in cell wall biosynthesis